jgi:hypothetical protein
VGEFEIEEQGRRCLSKLWESTKESNLQESMVFMNAKKKYTEAESAGVFMADRYRLPVAQAMHRSRPLDCK